MTRISPDQNEVDNKPLDKRIRAVETLAQLMDSQFKIPGTDIRFGLDPLLGLFPGGGDAIGFLASSAIVLTMVRHGASPQLALRMLINITIDATVGAIPLLGDLFDMAYKANNRNVRLMREYYEEGKYSGSVWPLFTAVVIALLLIGFVTYWILWQILSFLWNLIEAGLS